MTYNDYPKTAIDNAKKVLEWKEKYPGEIKGMTAIGWERANQLAKNESLSRDTISRISSFARHLESYNKAKEKSEYKNEPWKSASIVSVLGWGGEEMIKWAHKKLEEIDKEIKKSIFDDISSNIEIEDIIEKGGKNSGRKPKESAESKQDKAYESAETKKIAQSLENSEKHKAKEDTRTLKEIYEDLKKINPENYVFSRYGGSKETKSLLNFIGSTFSKPNPNLGSSNFEDARDQIKEEFGENAKGLFDYLKNSPLDFIDRVYKLKKDTIDNSTSKNENKLGDIKSPIDSILGEEPEKVNINKQRENFFTKKNLKRNTKHLFYTKKDYVDTESGEIKPGEKYLNFFLRQVLESFGVARAEVLSELNSKDKLNDFIDKKFKDEPNVAKDLKKYFNKDSNSEFSLEDLYDKLSKSEKVRDPYVKKELTAKEKLFKEAREREQEKENKRILEENYGKAARNSKDDMEAFESRAKNLPKEITDSEEYKEYMEHYPLYSNLAKKKKYGIEDFQKFSGETMPDKIKQNQLFEDGKINKHFNLTLQSIANILNVPEEQRRFNNIKDVTEFLGEYLPKNLAADMIKNGLNEGNPRKFFTSFRDKFKSIEDTAFSKIDDSLLEKPEDLELNVSNIKNFISDNNEKNKGINFGNDDLIHLPDGYNKEAFDKLSPANQKKVVEFSNIKGLVKNNLDVINGFISKISLIDKVEKDILNISKDFTSNKITKEEANKKLKEYSSVLNEQNSDIPLITSSIRNANFAYYSDLEKDVQEGKKVGRGEFSPKDRFSFHKISDQLFKNKKIEGSIDKLWDNINPELKSALEKTKNESEFDFLYNNFENKTGFREYAKRYSNNLDDKDVKKQYKDMLSSTSSELSFIKKKIERGDIKFNDKSNPFIKILLNRFPQLDQEKTKEDFISGIDNSQREVNTEYSKVFPKKEEPGGILAEGGTRVLSDDDVKREDETALELARRSAEKQGKNPDNVKIGRYVDETEEEHDKRLLGDVLRAADLNKKDLKDLTQKEKFKAFKNFLNLHDVYEPSHFNGFYKNLNIRNTFKKDYIGNGEHINRLRIADEIFPELAKIKDNKRAYNKRLNEYIQTALGVPKDDPKRLASDSNDIKTALDEFDRFARTENYFRHERDGWQNPRTGFTDKEQRFISLNEAKDAADNYQKEKEEKEKEDRRLNRKVSSEVKRDKLLEEISPDLKDIDNQFKYDERVKEIQKHLSKLSEEREKNQNGKGAVNHEKKPQTEIPLSDHENKLLDKRLTDKESEYQGKISTNYDRKRIGQEYNELRDKLFNIPISISDKKDTNKISPEMGQMLDLFAKVYNKPIFTHYPDKPELSRSKDEILKTFTKYLSEIFDGNSDQEKDLRKKFEQSKNSPNIFLRLLKENDLNHVLYDDPNKVGDFKTIRPVEKEVERKDDEFTYGDHDDRLVSQLISDNGIIGYGNINLIKRVVNSLGLNDIKEKYPDFFDTSKPVNTNTNKEVVKDLLDTLKKEYPEQFSSDTINFKNKVNSIIDENENNKKSKIDSIKDEIKVEEPEQEPESNKEPEPEQNQEPEQQVKEEPSKESSTETGPGTNTPEKPVDDVKNEENTNSSEEKTDSEEEVSPSQTPTSSPVSNRDEKGKRKRKEYNFKQNSDDDNVSNASKEGDLNKEDEKEEEHKDIQSETASGPEETGTNSEESENRGSDNNSEELAEVNSSEQKNQNDKDIVEDKKGDSKAKINDIKNEISVVDDSKKAPKTESTESNLFGGNATLKPLRNKNIPKKFSEQKEENTESKEAESNKDSSNISGLTNVDPEQANVLEQKEEEPNTALDDITEKLESSSTEEPKQEEPKQEEPVKEEPKQEEPRTEEVKEEEPVEDKVESPKVEQDKKISSIGKQLSLFGDEEQEKEESPIVSQEEINPEETSDDLKDEKASDDLKPEETEQEEENEASEENKETSTGNQEIPEESISEDNAEEDNKEPEEKPNEKKIESISEPIEEVEKETVPEQVIDSKENDNDDSDEYDAFDKDGNISPWYYDYITNVSKKLGLPEPLYNEDTKDFMPKEGETEEEVKERQVKAGKFVNAFNHYLNKEYPNFIEDAEKHLGSQEGDYNSEKVFNEFLDSYSKNKKEDSENNQETTETPEKEEETQGQEQQEKEDSKESKVEVVEEKEYHDWNDRDDEEELPNREPINFFDDEDKLTSSGLNIINKTAKKLGLAEKFEGSPEEGESDEDFVDSFLETVRKDFPNFDLDDRFKFKTQVDYYSDNGKDMPEEEFEEFSKRFYNDSESEEKVNKEESEGDDKFEEEEKEDLSPEQKKEIDDSYDVPDLEDEKDPSSDPYRKKREEKIDDISSPINSLPPIYEETDDATHYDDLSESEKRGRRRRLEELRDNFKDDENNHKYNALTGDGRLTRKSIYLLNELNEVLGLDMEDQIENYDNPKKPGLLSRIKDKFSKTVNKDKEVKSNKQVSIDLIKEIAEAIKNKIGTDEYQDHFNLTNLGNPKALIDGLEKYYPEFYGLENEARKNKKPMMIAPEPKLNPEGMDQSSEKNPNDNVRQTVSNNGYDSSVPQVSPGSYVKIDNTYKPEEEQNVEEEENNNTPESITPEETETQPENEQGVSNENTQENVHNAEEEHGNETDTETSSESPVSAPQPKIGDVPQGPSNSGEEAKVENSTVPTTQQNSTGVVQNNQASNPIQGAASTGGIAGTSGGNKGGSISGSGIAGANPGASISMPVVADTSIDLSTKPDPNKVSGAGIPNDYTKEQTFSEAEKETRRAHEAHAQQKLQEKQDRRNNAAAEGKEPEKPITTVPEFDKPKQEVTNPKPADLSNLPEDMKNQINDQRDRIARQRAEAEKRGETFEEPPISIKEREPNQLRTQQSSPEVGPKLKISGDFTNKRGENLSGRVDEDGNQTISRENDDTPTLSGEGSRKNNPKLTPTKVLVKRADGSTYMRTVYKNMGDSEMPEEDNDGLKQIDEEQEMPEIQYKKLNSPLDIKTGDLIHLKPEGKEDFHEYRILKISEQVVQRKEPSSFYESGVKYKNNTDYFALVKDEETGETRRVPLNRDTYIVQNEDDFKSFADSVKEAEDNGLTVYGKMNNVPNYKFDISKFAKDTVATMSDTDDEDFSNSYKKFGDGVTVSENNYSNGSKGVTISFESLNPPFKEIKIVGNDNKASMFITRQNNNSFNQDLRIDMFDNINRNIKDNSNIKSIVLKNGSKNGEDFFTDTMLGFSYSPEHIYHKFDEFKNSKNINKDLEYKDADGRSNFIKITDDEIEKRMYKFYSILAINAKPHIGDQEIDFSKEKVSFNKPVSFTALLLNSNNEIDPVMKHILESTSNFKGNSEESSDMILSLVNPESKIYFNNALSNSSQNKYNEKLENIREKESRNIRFEIPREYSEKTKKNFSHNTKNRK